MSLLQPALIAPANALRATPRTRQSLSALRRWFDTGAEPLAAAPRQDGIDWLRTVPFIGLHAACLGVFWVEVSAVALYVAAALYMVRMFTLTGFYHRYFSHRTFKTSRASAAGCAPAASCSCICLRTGI